MESVNVYKRGVHSCGCECDGASATTDDGADDVTVIAGGGPGPGAHSGENVQDQRGRVWRFVSVRITEALSCWPIILMG